MEVEYDYFPDNDNNNGCSIVKNSNLTGNVYKFCKGNNEDNSKIPGIMHHLSINDPNTSFGGEAVYISNKKTQLNNICQTRINVNNYDNNNLIVYYNYYTINRTNLTSHINNDPECQNSNDIGEAYNILYPQSDKDKFPQLHAPPMPSAPPPPPPPPPPPIEPELEQPYTYYQCIKTENEDNTMKTRITTGICPNTDTSSLTVEQCISLSYDNNGNVTTNVTPGGCPAQFTNVKSGRKSRKIERFESNNNLKCKARY